MTYAFPDALVKLFQLDQAKVSRGSKTSTSRKIEGVDCISSISYIILYYYVLVCCLSIHKEPTPVVTTEAVPLYSIISSTLPSAIPPSTTSEDWMLPRGRDLPSVRPTK